MAPGESTLRMYSNKIEQLMKEFDMTRDQVLESKEFYLKMASLPKESGMNRSGYATASINHFRREAGMNGFKLKGGQIYEANAPPAKRNMSSSSMKSSNKRRKMASVNIDKKLSEAKARVRDLEMKVERNRKAIKAWHKFKEDVMVKYQTTKSRRNELHVKLKDFLGILEKVNSESGIYKDKRGVWHTKSGLPNGPSHPLVHLFSQAPDLRKFLENLDGGSAVKSKEQVTSPPNMKKDVIEMDVSPSDASPSDRSAMSMPVTPVNTQTSVRQTEVTSAVKPVIATEIKSRIIGDEHPQEEKKPEVVTLSSP